jgi:hypothetical protein
VVDLHYLLAYALGSLLALGGHAVCPRGGRSRHAS